jgi:N-acetylneuraminic acid mutarotase
MESMTVGRLHAEMGLRGRAGVFLVCFALALATAGCVEPPEDVDMWNSPSLHWQTLPSLPDAHGFAGGYSGTLEREGISYLMFAGGANFSKGFPWEGGEKQWYDDIYLSDGVSDWNKVGKLPSAAAYGLSVSHEGNIYLIGGDHGGGNPSDAVYALSLQENDVRMITLPPLPQATYNLCGAIIGESIYVAGGTDGSRTFADFWSLNLARPEDGWQSLPTWPGPPRMLAVAGVVDDEFFLFGGVELVGSEDTLSRQYLRDAYAYSEDRGWRKLADMPVVRAASPSPAISLGSRQQLIVLAGSDGSLDGQNDILREHHPGFPIDNYIYDVPSDSWQLHSVMPRVRGHLTPTGRDGVWSPVTTNTVLWNGGVVVPSGEIKPGVRTPKILFATLPDWP